MKRHSTLRNLVREAVRLVISEAARTPADASAAGLALSIFDSGRSKTYVLWDPRALEAAVRDGLERGNVTNEGELSAKRVSPRGSIVAMIDVWKPEPGESWEAATVQRSGAERGWGPMMYDVAMADNGRLAPDRGAVSDSAARVWGTYFGMRRDVKRLPFDDVERPRTPPVVDDSLLHSPRTPGNSLNYAYEMTPSARSSVKSAVMELIRTGNAALSGDLRGLGVTKGFVSELARAYFVGKF